MKIAIEAQRIFRKHKHGMDFVALNMIRELQLLDHVNEYRIYVARGEDVCLESTENFKIEVLGGGSYPFWEQVSLALAIRGWKPDLLHCTSNTAPLILPYRVRLITTLHDVIFMEPLSSANTSRYQRFGRIYRRLVVPFVVRRSLRIITVSGYERAQIDRVMGICPAKIDVVYNGVSEIFKPTPLTHFIKDKYKLPRDYFLFLGNTDPKKNTARTMRSYARYLDLCEQNGESPLSLVVGELTHNTLVQLTEEGVWARVAEHVVPVGYIVSNDLVMIYSGARAFLYTSLRESFGIPPLEAMACGTPVMSSSVSAIPEVLGQAALLVDPMDVEKMATGMYDIATDNLLRYNLIEQGYVQSSKYRWNNAARHVQQIYEELCEIKIM